MTTEQENTWQSIIRVCDFELRNGKKNLIVDMDVLVTVNSALEMAEGTAGHLRECLAKTEEKLAKYARPFADPQSAATGTVAEMRVYARGIAPCSDRVNRRAAELEAAQARIAELGADRKIIHQYDAAIGEAKARIAELEAVLANEETSHRGTIGLCRELEAQLKPTFAGIPNDYADPGAGGAA